MRALLQNWTAIRRRVHWSRVSGMWHVDGAPIRAGHRDHDLGQGRSVLLPLGNGPAAGGGELDVVPGLVRLLLRDDVVDVAGVRGGAAALGGGPGPRGRLWGAEGQAGECPCNR